ncbi:MAG: methyltransferase [Methyloprofundus sp.]|nr:methyltransferase [Methyloprofundus sp.]
MTETFIHVAQGAFQLLRFPIEKDERLRAWDAADEYLLNDVAAKIAIVENPRVLIINDSFGALAVALNAVNPCSISDSYLSQRATTENLVLNQLVSDRALLFNSLDLPVGQFDFILIKAPKTLAFLEDMLIRLQTALKPETQVIIAGMVKNMPASIWQTLERLVGKTTPSRAVKKARLIYASPESQRTIPANPYPVCYQLENTEYQVCNHANVFSHQRLDIGTRFFLQHLPQDKKYQQVVDLGCGNGVVGLIFAAKNPAAYVHFIDESFMAVASAEQNFKQAFAGRMAGFTAADALSGFTPGSVDLVLCNPPFHQQNTIGNHIAMRMFKQAKSALRSGGELWVIGNRHLAYQFSLTKYFSKVELLVSNAKFIIVKAS